jgi:Protein of unknown function (DUF664)
MENLNFSRDLAGRRMPPPWDAVDRAAEPGWEWRSAAGDPPDLLYALWHDAVARSRSAVAAALAGGGMDGLSRTPAGAEFTLRRLLVDMIEEYARHTGHADLLRESIDGRTGEDPPGTPYPYQLPTTEG